jgi:hypothetical protein
MITSLYKTICVMTLLGLAASPVIGADAVSSLAPAPVPVQVLSAKKVFLSNLGADAEATVALRAMTDPEVAFDGFFAAMKSSGQYELTATPLESDLILEFRVTAAPLSSGSYMQYLTYLNLSVMDTKSHYVLWTFSAPLQLTKKIDESVNVSVATLVNSMKSRLATSRARQSGQ